MWISRSEIENLRAELRSQEKRILLLENQVVKTELDLVETNTRVSRVSMASGLTTAEIYREKAK